MKESLINLGYTPDQIDSNGKALKLYVVEVLSLGRNKS